MKTVVNRCNSPLLWVAVSLLAGTACKKSASGNNTSPVTVVSDTLPTDPSTESSIGFFMDNWVAKSFTTPVAVTDKAGATGTADGTVTIDAGQVITKIAPTYFGNNTNPYIGQIGTNATLLNQLSSLAPQIIRAPGGSLSDIYFFNAATNSPPADAPDTLLDGTGNKYKVGYWYGKNTDSWTQSLDNYYALLSGTNSKGVITVNYAYARYGTSANPVATAAHLAADWVRYDKGRTKYWEIGNESAGNWEAGYRIDVSKNKDGQPELISGSLYGKHFTVFADSMRKAAAETGAAIYIGAQLIQDANPSAVIDKAWNSGYFSQAVNTADFYIVHDYYTPYNQNTNAADIMATASSETNAVMSWLKTSIANGGVAMKPIAMTEWNLFASGSKQNVSHIAGMHAVLTIGAFINNKFGAAIRWDLANGWANGDDHGLFSLEDEPGVAKWNARPAFYHLYFLQKCMGDRLLASTVSGVTDIVAIASSFSSGQKAVTLVNKATSAKTVSVNFNYFTPGSKYYYYVLNGGSDNGEFSRQVLVNAVGPDNGIAGGPSTYQTIKMYGTSTAGGIRITVPARAVVLMVVEKK